MHKTYFFESGLPRSGSTLLSAILNQNPDLHCGAISPVLEVMYYTEQYFEGSEQALAYPKPDQHHKIISSVIDNYYSDRNEKYVIDKCRAWTNNVDRIKKYITKTPKILCPVRDVLEILASFIEMIHPDIFKETLYTLPEIIDNLYNLKAPDGTYYVTRDFDPSTIKAEKTSVIIQL